MTISAVVLTIREWKSDWRTRGLLVWLAAIALPLCFIRNKQSHYLIPLLPVLMILTGWIIDRWTNRPLIIATIVTAVILPPLVTLVLPIYSREHTRQTTEFVRGRFGASPLCFYGQNASIPLCFNLRRAIPTANDEAELTQFIGREPGIIVITIGKDKRPATAPASDRFEKLEERKWEDQVWDFYRVTP